MFEEQLQIIYLLVTIGWLILMYRLITNTGWYIQAINHNKIQITDEFISYTNRFLTEEHISSFVSRSTYAMIWLFITFPITIMATVGGNTLAETNIAFKLPCFILILIMQLISISKIIIIIAEFIEEWIIGYIMWIYIGMYAEKYPLEIYGSKKGIVHTRPKKKVNE